MVLGMRCRRLMSFSKELALKHCVYSFNLLKQHFVYLEIANATHLI